MEKLEKVRDVLMHLRGAEIALDWLIDAEKSLAELADVRDAIREAIERVDVHLVDDSSQVSTPADKQGISFRDYHKRLAPMVDDERIRRLKRAGDEKQFPGCAELGIREDD